MGKDFRSWCCERSDTVKGTDQEGGLSRRRLRMQHSLEKISAKLTGDNLEQNFPTRGAPYRAATSRPLYPTPTPQAGLWVGSSLGNVWPLYKHCRGVKTQRDLLLTLIISPNANFISWLNLIVILQTNKIIRNPPPNSKMKLSLLKELEILWHFSTLARSKY